MIAERNALARRSAKEGPGACSDKGRKFMLSAESDATAGVRDLRDDPPISSAVWKFPCKESIARLMAGKYGDLLSRVSLPPIERQLRDRR